MVRMIHSESDHNNMLDLAGMSCIYIYICSILKNAVDMNKLVVVLEIAVNMRHY